MFGLFKKAQPPTPQVIADQVFSKVRPFYRDVLDLVEHIDGPFPRLWEAGLFAGAIAAAKIEQYPRPDADEICGEFCLLWLGFLTMNPNDTSKPTDDEVSERFWDKFPVYKALFESALSNKDLSKNPEFQLLWELFTNCTDKAKPADFLKLTAATGVLAEVLVEILQAAQEPT